jgi:uncharacterized protein YyaL (SSP411 family)
MNGSSSNKLSQERSSYLKSAAHQPIHWFPWSEEAFQKAKELNRPILLDIGAVWCHWCHVMDGESYEDTEVAQFINEHFIAIKVDRDERPDLDSRYQMAVSAITGQGGWPLTAFLTPEGRVFFGGTYFPPDDKYGRPGFKSVLTQVKDYYHANLDKVQTSAEGLYRELARHAVETKPGILSYDLITEAIEQISKNFDFLNGGFGTAPKFPHPGALELLLREAFYRGKQDLAAIAARTLEKMGKGGVYDQIGGGFHRYSTDERWVVPHFEKMAYDNSELLKNCLHCYQATGKEIFKEIALGIIDYVRSVLSDPDQGGFYASQDADISMHDDGDYFTWTVEEAERALSQDEFRVVQLYYNIGPRGEMHVNTAKNVLFIDMEPDAIAAKLGLPESKVLDLIKTGKQRLLEARMKRPTPFIDKTVYLNWNGMMIAAFLEAYKILALPACKELALKTLELLIVHAYNPGYGFAHSLLNGEPKHFGLLDDQVQMGVALLDAYEVTAEEKYLEKAEAVAKLLLEKFWDDPAGGFFDRAKDNIPTVLGAAHPQKPIQDSPTPSANGVAVMFLDRLAHLTSNVLYRERAEEALKAFAETCRDMGLFAATYFQALSYHLLHPAQALIVGRRNDPATQNFLSAALKSYRPGKIVRLLDPQNRLATPPPPALAGMLQNAKLQSEPVVYVCVEISCAPPARTVEELTQTLTAFGVKNV